MTMEITELKEMIDFKSRKRIDILKKRTKRCKCKYCGGKLKLRRIIFSDYEDSRIEIYCNQCDRIEYGVEAEIYQSAKYFVENSEFNCYPDLNANEKTKQMTIAKVCEIMAWQCQNFGIMNENGFTIALKINENFVGECIILTDEDLDEDDDFIEDKYALE
ncbi:MAG: hypothetical protein IJC12_01540 [Peptococcaceae bacterium]|nr:hypothetical protein [Peptococcaceae bacterium]